MQKNHYVNVILLQNMIRFCNNITDLQMHMSVVPLILLLVHNFMYI